MAEYCLGWQSCQDLFMYKIEGESLGPGGARRKAGAGSVGHEARRGRTQEAAGDLVHEAARLQAVQAQHQDVELLIEGQRLLLDAAVVRRHLRSGSRCSAPVPAQLFDIFHLEEGDGTHRDVLHALHDPRRRHLGLALAHVLHPARPHAM